MVARLIWSLLANPSTIEAVVCCNLGSTLQHDANIESRHDLFFDFYCCLLGVCLVAHFFLIFFSASINMPILECPCGRQFHIHMEATLKKKLIERQKSTSLQPSRGLIDLPMSNQVASQRSTRSPSPHRADANHVSSWKPTWIGGSDGSQPMTSSSSGQEYRQHHRLELKKLRCDLTNLNYWDNWQESTPGAEGSNSRRPSPPVCEPPQYLLEDRSRSPRKPQYLKSSSPQRLRS